MSAAPLFYGNWPVEWNGTVPGTADTSLTAPSNVTVLGTAGGDLSIVQPGGTTTTVSSSFTIAAVSLTQSITVGAALALNAYVFFNDGTHAFYGQVTSNPGTTPTVTTRAITLGASGNTMAANAIVMPCGPISSAGAKIEQIRLNQIATNSAACMVNLFKHDGTTYHFFDYFPITVASTLSATLQVAPVDKYYANLFLPIGWSLRATVTASAGASAFRLNAWGAYN
jgi:hypothetical protein